MNIGYRIKELREEKQITQSELAKMIGITQDSISLWEQGRRVPNTPYLIPLCKIFNISIDYLLGYNNESTESKDASIISQDEQYLLRAYRQMSDGKKQALFKMLDLDESVIDKRKT